MNKTQSYLSLFIATLLLTSSIVCSQTICYTNSTNGSVGGSKTKNIDKKKQAERGEILSELGETKQISKDSFIVIQKQKENLAKTDSLILLLEQKIAEKEK